MKLYLVIERDGGVEDCDDIVFGVFTDEVKARQIRNDVLASFEETYVYTDIEIVELTLNEVTEAYEYFMNN